jgi:hypothetical protein
MPLNFFIADRVKELSRVADTGNITLDGAVVGFSSFGDFFASGDTVFYAITDNVKYEVGSGQYVPDGSDRALTRNVFRSSNLNSGPYYVYGSGSTGTGAGQAGHFHPVYLTRSSALSGVGISTGPFGGVTEHSLSGYPGITFYMPVDHQGVAESYHAGLSGVDYNASGAPVDFDAGVKEVFVTYPGKTAVYNAYGLGSDVKEPKESGLAFWKNEQVINYTSQLVWDDDNNFLGVYQSNPGYAIDVGGDINYSIIHASGFIDGGSGVMFSGVAGSYSGGRQLEPFMRNELDPTTGSNAIFYHSGIVNQRLMLEKQLPKTMLMGPSGECGCVDDYPTFRTLTASDIPGLGGEFVIQNNTGADAVSAYPFTLGQVALYKASGEISYDSGILYDTANGRLGLGGSLVGQIDPAYTLDVSGNMAVNSGYFDQIIFDNSLIRIGNNAGTDAGNFTSNHYLVNISDNAGYAASGMFDAVLIGRYAGSNTNTSSGVVAIGFNSLWNGTENNNGVFIGDYAGYEASGSRGSVIIGSGAGSGLLSDYDSVFLGTHVAAKASEVSNSVAIGHQALQNSSGNITWVHAIGLQAGSDARILTNATLIGNKAGSKGYSIVTSNVIGMNAGYTGSGISQSNLIGSSAGEGASGLSYVNAIGYQSASGARSSEYLSAIGSNAAASSSGTHNIYVGHNAGVSVSGHENIEIIGSGGAASFLTHEASGKINIAKTIVGDMYTGRVAVGIPSDASPNATLDVTTKYADDPGFILKHQGSGSNQPYFALQSGDATTIYQITNSGSVITSGYMTPSGGLNLPSVAKERVMLNSGVGGYMLWNDAGTLTWNGAGVGGGGSYSNWGLTTGTEAADAITDGQTVTISGVSGVETQYDAANNFLRISASGLSGVLQNQITASTYTFSAVASGVDANNNEVMPMPTNSVLVVSGVSGIHADFTNSNDGTNVSGIFTIGYDPSTTYSWNIATSGATDTFTNAETLNVSGVSGILVDYDGNVNQLRISASGLSGVLQGQVDSNFTTWSGILSNGSSPSAMVGSFSGVSGIAAYASGVVTGFTTASATSGVKYQDNTYIFDPDGSGQVAHLTAINFDKSVTIGGGVNGAVAFNSGVAIGYDAGGLSPGERSISIGGNGTTAGHTGIAIGYQAHALGNRSIAFGPRAVASGDTSISIGYNAGQSQGTPVGNDLILIGQQAGYINSGCSDSIMIGKEAGMTATGVPNSVGIGNHALASSRMTSYNIAIGHSAGVFASGNNRDIFIGNMAGWGTNDDGYGIGGYSIFIGDYAGQSASGYVESIAIGRYALKGSHGTADVQPAWNIAIGNSALSESWNFKNVIAIGDHAGFRTSGVGPLASDQAAEGSILIGDSAGHRRSGRSSIILSNRLGGWNSSVEPVTHDCPWASHDEDYVLDIGNTIQGLMDSKNVHIGASLSGNSSSDITDAALSVTPDQNSDMALKLNRHSSQAAGLLKAVSSVGTENNEIINQDGFLRITVATTRSGSYPNVVLKDSHSHTIPCKEGVIVLKANTGAGVPSADIVELWVGVDYGVTGPIWKQLS